jgi:hypothetical protein
MTFAIILGGINEKYSNQKLTKILENERIPNTFVLKLIVFDPEKKKIRCHLQWRPSESPRKFVPEGLTRMCGSRTSPTGTKRRGT